MLQVIDKFLKINDFKELHKYQLKTAEWEVLDAFKSILQVKNCDHLISFWLTFLQIPHAFQQKLSAEKTPTLGNALPCFEAMARSWEALKSKQSKYASIISEGLDKLETYRLYTEEVPAYTLAMSTCSLYSHSPAMLIYLFICLFQVINPALKLDWYEEHYPKKMARAKAIFINAVCHLCSELYIWICYFYI